MTPSKDNPYPPIALEHLVFEGVLSALRQTKKLDPSRKFELKHNGLCNVSGAVTKAMIKFYAETNPSPTQVGCANMLKLNRNTIKKFLWKPLDKLRYPW